MEIQSEIGSDCLLLRVSGDLRLWGHAGEETRLLDALRSRETLPAHLILNMSGISRLDSTGIGSLVRVLIECGKRHVEFRAVLPLGLPGEMLTPVRVFEAWPKFKDESSALTDAGRAATA